MCGFCGVIGPAGGARVQDIERMTAALAHRGPDDTGTWRGRFQDADRDWEIALGHTRLSILDLSAHGHQPMLSDDGVTVLAYNGEIYNFREIRAQLIRRHVRFRSESDSEVLLQAWRSWGLESIERLNGMFAFAIWDAREKQLVLVRDRLGIKPLSYRHADGVLSFGSELSALRAHSGFAPKISPAGLETFLRFGFLSGEQTIYSDTKRLLPGHVLIWKAGQISTQPYWELTDYAPEGPPESFDALVDRLDELLGSAVELQLVSDVPLGAFLSGGVDSSTVVALMQERATRRVKTFSIGFANESFDEAPYARAVAKHLGTEHTELYVEREAAREVVRALPKLYDEPFADASAVPTVLLSRMTRQHVKVSLSGDGGDELFGGYTRYAKLARLLPLLRVPFPLRKLLRPATGKETALANGLRKLATSRDRAELAESFLAQFDEELLRAACRRTGPRALAAFSQVFRESPAGSPVRRAMYADARTYMTDDVLAKVDRASMSTGLEARVPILDHRVVELAFRTPDRFLRRRGQTKAPLRAVLYRRVPPELIERPKMGFGFPVQDLLGFELESWQRKYLDPKRIAEEGLLDPDAVATMTALATRRAHDSRLWTLLCFQRWFAVNHRGEAGH